MTTDNRSKNDESICNFGDEGPDSPQLNTFLGFDDCQNCYFRLSTVERIAQATKQLREGGQ